MRAAPHQPAFLPHPLAVLAASFALGILAARFTALPFKLAMACGAACSLAAVYSYVRRRALATCITLVVAFFFVGAALMILEKGSVTGGRVERLYEAGVIESGSPVEVT